MASPSTRPTRSSTMICAMKSDSEAPIQAPSRGSSSIHLTSVTGTLECSATCLANFRRTPIAMTMVALQESLLASCHVVDLHQSKQNVLQHIAYHTSRGVRDDGRLLLRNANGSSEAACS